MKLEQQVVSLELAKKLKELGVKQESYLCWLNENFSNSYDDYQHVVEKSDYQGGWHIKDRISAFTVAELGEMLKQSGLSSGYSDEDIGWYCQSTIHNKFDLIGEESEADARAKMLIYLLENDLLKTPSPETTNRAEAS
ncbi:MAG TPA: hypothetical protein VE974_06235 [Thermoanaerobaculia bacterium]|nr:hypothetical protein [Thermoanaerobaculia bacterium]